MALVVADRVSDLSTTTGTGTVTLAGTPPTGFRSFASVCTNGDTTYYAIAHQTANEWEVGLGTYTGGTLSRDSIYASSNSGSAVNFSSGTKDVYIVAPAEQMVLQSRNLSDLQSASTARTNLGLGSAATQSTSTFLQTANNLSDLANAGTARTNLGLGSLATQSGTFSGTSSGTNTGDQLTYKTVAVSGQTSIVAGTATDTLNVAAGSNVTLTTTPGTNTLTIAASGGGGAGAAFSEFLLIGA